MLYWRDFRCPDLLPSIFLILQFTLLVDPAWPNLFKQTDQTRAPWATIDPDGQWSIFRLAIPSFEEPPEDRLLGRDVDVAGVRLDAGSELANTLRDFLVANGLIVESFCRGKVRRRTDELAQCERDNGERRCGSSPGRHLERRRAPLRGTIARRLRRSRSGSCQRSGRTD